MKDTPEILLYGIGNPGRNDDGCGIVCVEKIRQWIEAEGIENVHCETNYQLNIEDSEFISRYDLVVFVDATVEPIRDIKCTPVHRSDARIEFTMHAVAPSFVLDLCSKIFNRVPEAYLLQIKGDTWEFREGLSPSGHYNVEKAVDRLKNMVAEKCLSKA
jgi:hydrogenase maturation protease